MLTRNQPFAPAGSGDDEICGGIHRRRRVRVSPRGAARPRDPNAVRRGRGRIAAGSDRLGHVSRHGDREPHAAEGARGVRRQRRPRVDRRRRGAQARGQRAPSPSSSPSSRPSRRPTSPPARRRSKGSPDPVRPVGAFIRGGADCNPAGQPFVVEVRPAMGRAAAFSKPRSTRPARAPVTAERSLYLQSGCSSWEIALVASPSGRVPLRKVKKPTVASLDGRTLRQDRSSRPYDPNTSPRSCGVLACASPARAAFRT